MDTPENKRSQRKKIDKEGRGAALDRLKQLKEKGVKNKYEVRNLENIYDTVDEKEYEKKVWERQDDDWIVDDDGSGYVEDGREIFDDDLDADSVEAASKKGKDKNKKLSRNTDTQVGKRSIQSMFSNMPASKISKKEHNVNEDDLLTDLLDEIKTISKSKFPTKKSSTVTKFQQLDSSPKIIIRDESPPRSITKPKQGEPSTVITSLVSQESTTLIEDYSEPMDVTESLQKIEEVGSQQKDMTILEAVFDDDDIQMDTDLINTMEGVEIQNMQVEFKENITNNISKAKDPIDIFNDDKFFTEWEENEVKHQIINEKEITKNSDQTTSIDKCDLDSFMIENSEDDKVLRFFWWDAFEMPSHPGSVFLFGKIFFKNKNTYVSCCIQVENIERKFYVLPRKYHYNMRTHTFTDQEVTMIDVYNEFNKKFAKGKQFRSKPTTKLYCFDIENVPPNAEYLEVRFPAEHGRISKEEMAGETIQHIFGTDTNFLELFLLDRKIKGPCWLDIVDADFIHGKQISWSKMEFHCTMRNITITQTDLPPPPLILAALTIRTALNPSNNQNEIIMISCLTQSKYEIHKSAPDPPYENNHFCVITRPSGVSWSYDHIELFRTYKATKVQKCDSERALLNFFLTQFLKIDPDVIVGHDFIGYQLDVLFHRLLTLKIGNWSLFGKLRLKTMPMRIKNIQQDLCAGRLVCDLKISAKELIKSRSYDLNTLCSNVLKMDEFTCFEIEQDEIINLYEVPNGLRKLIAWTMKDTSCILKIIYELNVMPLAVQITNTTGFILSKTLLGGRSERNEYLLLHAFTENNYIVPDKYKQIIDSEGRNETKAGGSKKKPQYTGGLVLEPKVGFYNTYILLMDFNSLYPSIIQEYNICFTGLNLISPDEDDDDQLTSSINRNRHHQELEMGILPTEIKKLVNTRREVKNLMKQTDGCSDLFMKYNIKQLALKLTANSMYGCLGYNKSRFYAQKLASKITELGREILQKTQLLVKNLCYEVVYGDTDSLMINTNIRDYEQVLKIGLQIKQEVNKHYKEVELDIDGVFQYLLLLKKKKYAARIVTKDKRGNLVYQQEIKGLDIVRRDWCQLAAKAGKFVLDNLLCDYDEDTRMEAIFSYLSTLRDKLEKNEIPLADLAITKQLTKNPAAYTDMKALPHVQVAMRYNLKNAGKRLRQGDTVHYVICDDGTDKNAMQRGYHVDELKSSLLKIDTKYYLLQQVYPLVNRLCEPIDYIQSEQIAKHLGLEGLSFKQVLKPIDKIHMKDTTSTKNEFIGTKPFRFKCPACLTMNQVTEPMIKSSVEEDFKFVLDACQNLKCTSQPIFYIKSIQNQLTLECRKYIKKYYYTNFICDDPLCSYSTKTPPIRCARNFYPICVCNNGLMYKEYDTLSLYRQLHYFVHIFDVNKIEKKPLISSQLQAGYDALVETVTTFMNDSEYFYINLENLFNSFDETKLNKKIGIDFSDDEGD